MSPFKPQPVAAPAVPALGSGGIGVVTETPALYHQLVNVIQLRETQIHQWHPQALAGKPLPAVTLWVVGLSDVGQRPLWLDPLLASNAPLIAVMPHWHDDAAVALFDAQVADILVAPVPDVYLATRVLKVLKAADAHQQLTQAYQVLAGQGLRSAEGIWQQSCWADLVAPWFNTVANGPISTVVWQLETMSPQVASLLRNQLVTLCRGDDVVIETQPRAGQPSRLVTLLPHTDDTACQGFLQRVSVQVPGVYPHQVQVRTVMSNPQGYATLQHVLGA